MASFLENLLGQEGVDKDQVIANNMLASLKSLATLYLTAALESATPELRRLYGEYLTQVLTAHEQATKIAVEKGWYNPYDAPVDQLKGQYDQSSMIINQQQA